MQIIHKEKYNNVTNKTSFKENIPFCKFYYYQNGTLVKIYYPEGMDEFYKSAMNDLIEKITPKLSKSLYQNKTDKRRLQNEQDENVKLNYEHIVKNGTLEKIIIYEDKVQNDFQEKSTKLNSKMIRTFNSSGDITSLEMKGEAIFKSISPKKKDDSKHNEKKNLRSVEEETKYINFETNETYNNLGFNEFNMNVTSNMELIHNEIEPKILEKLIKISKLISFEIYKEPKEIFTHEEIKDNIYNNSEEYHTEKEKRNLDEENIINFPRTYLIYFKLTDSYFLNKRIIIEQELYINPNTNLRKDTIRLTLGPNKILHELSTYQDLSGKPSYKYKYISEKYYGFDSGFNPFGFSIRVELYLLFRVSHSLDCSVKYQQMYTKGYASYDVSVGGSFGPDFFLSLLGEG